MSANKNGIGRVANIDLNKKITIKDLEKLPKLYEPPDLYGKKKIEELNKVANHTD